MYAIYILLHFSKMRGNYKTKNEWAGELYSHCI